MNHLTRPWIARQTGVFVEDPDLPAQPCICNCVPSVALSPEEREATARHIVAVHNASLEASKPEARDEDLIAAVRDVLTDFYENHNHEVFIAHQEALREAFLKYERFPA